MGVRWGWGAGIPSAPRLRATFKAEILDTHPLSYRSDVHIPRNTPFASYGVMSCGTLTTLCDRPLRPYPQADPAPITLRDPSPPSPSPGRPLMRSVSLQILPLRTFHIIGRTQCVVFRG